MTLTLLLALFAANAQKKAKPIKLLIEAEQISELQKIDPQLCRFVVGDKVKVNDKVCDVLIPSTMRGGRIDFIYGSERFVKTMIKAKSPKLGFTNGTHDKTTNFFKNRGSDHLPLIVDFKWR